MTYDVITAAVAERDGGAKLNGHRSSSLPDIGLTAEQWATRTGFGLRHVAGCEPVDTLAAKFLAGALTVRGVMSVLYGLDSPEHHAGRVIR